MFEQNRMTAYDKLDWHYDAAVRAGQPAENAFTHIGLYLAWIIRHDLHDPDAFPADHVLAVKSGGMSGSDLADDIDGKLVADVLSAEGNAFTDAYYDRYLEDYAATFAHLPDYGVVDEPDNYGRIEEVIDRRYQAWVADGRPAPASGEDDPAVDTDSDPGAARELTAELDQLIAELDFVRELPNPDQLPHVAPDLERLVPADLTDPPMDVYSTDATDWNSSLLNRALRRLGVRPDDTAVASAIGGSGPSTFVVTLYAVLGADAARLQEEFRLVIERPGRGPWETREIAGRTVMWADERAFAAASGRKPGSSSM